MKSVIEKQSFWADLVNMLCWRPIYREPKERTLSDARAEIKSARSRRKGR